MIGLETEEDKSTGKKINIEVADPEDLREEMRSFYQDIFRKQQILRWPSSTEHFLNSQEESLGYRLFKAFLKLEYLHYFTPFCRSNILFAHPLLVATIQNLLYTKPMNDGSSLNHQS